MTKKEDQIIKATREFAEANDIPFNNAHESIVLNAMRESAREERKWYKQSHRPPYGDKKEGFSISVLIYSPSMDLSSIGWFDFINDCWSHIADEELADFVWTKLPKYKR